MIRWVRDRLDDWLINRALLRARVQGLEKRVARMERESERLLATVNMLDARERQGYARSDDARRELARLRELVHKDVAGLAHEAEMRMEINARVCALEEAGEGSVVYMFGQEIEVKS